MRTSTFSAYGRVLAGLRSGQLATLRAQEQLSSGRRILRPSDDPTGAARALSLRGALSRSLRIQDTVASGRDQLDLAASTLQHSSELLSRARQLFVQAMTGALNENDRATIASELVEIRKELLDDANLRVDQSYVFGGTRTGAPPWSEVVSGGTRHTVYLGNQSEQSIQAGEDVLVAITAAGDRLFGQAEPGRVRFDGLTGVRSGATADEGSGFAYLTLRHDSTDVLGLVDVGLTLVDGGGEDTFLGAHALVIDGTAGTVRLGDGPVVTIPGPGERSDVVVRNAAGGELHLDFTLWTGGDLNETANGRGSISLDGETFTALTFTETDLELRDDALGQVLHVDTRNVARAGRELVVFGETSNPFDLLQGVIDDLRNEQGLGSGELIERLGTRLEDLDRVHDQMLVGLGSIGARSARLTAASRRQDELELELGARLSSVEDADFAEAALELARSQTILEVAQASGARVIQTSLLNFLR
jgi:flagellin-like hook-associated protein FlgL